VGYLCSRHDPREGDQMADGLASVHTLHVETYPKINYGVDVEHSDRFLAGDGPLVAAFLRALGRPATLYSNPVADDPTGREILTRLHGWDVTLAPSPGQVPSTRTNTVVVDQAGNRTWFSGLRGILTELDGLDLAELVRAPVVYLDCYEVLRDAPRPVLEAALEAGCDVVVNLGGSPPPNWLQAATGGRLVGVVQTNADEHDPADSARTLDALCDLGVAEVAVVTAGRQGAIAHRKDGQAVTAPACARRIWTRHCGSRARPAAYGAAEHRTLSSPKPRRSPRCWRPNRP
jgi:sugar/nucleoside kinase (ribokinase family)